MRLDIKLEKGEVYDIVESCGMFALKGKFLGVGEKGYSKYLVFENVTKEIVVNKYFTAIWDFNTYRLDKPDLCLRSKHYSDNIAALAAEPMMKLK